METIQNVDIFLLILLAAAFLIILIITKAIQKKRSHNKKIKILRPVYVVTSFMSAATVYMGFSAIWLAVFGKLLFNRTLVVSQELIIGLAGFVLIGIGINALYQSAKDKVGKLW